MVKTPDRRKKKQLCHVNMLKMYHARPDVVKTVNIATVVSENEQKNKDSDVSEMMGSTFRLQNSSVIENLVFNKLSHLAPALQEDVAKLITKYKSLFPDVPGRTTAVHYDIDVCNSSP